MNGLINMDKITAGVIIVVLIVAVGGFIMFDRDDQPIIEKTLPIPTATNNEVTTSTEKDSQNNNQHIVTTTSTTTTTTSNTSTSLNLSNQGLTKTPNDVFARTNLEELNLSNNKIDGSLQAEVRNLQNLKVLNLSNNKFTGVPAEIGQLKNLEVLDLSNNLITGLPLELGNLKNLKQLNLKGNAYSKADLATIKKTLTASVVIQVD